MAMSPVIMWFRDDQRLCDNLAFHALAVSGRPVICIYIHEDSAQGLRRPAGAALWWLHGSLNALDRSLRRLGGCLHVLSGQAGRILTAVVEHSGAQAVYWNRRYDAAGRNIDTRIKQILRERGIDTRSFNGKLLYEPWTIKTGSGGAYRVFTAFWRAARSYSMPDMPLPAPQNLVFAALKGEFVSRFVDAGGLSPDPQKPDWAACMRSMWVPGEEGARQQLARFLDAHLPVYADERDMMDRQATSLLSPALRAGNISARQVWHAVIARQGNACGDLDRHCEKFLAELGWREFCYHLLYHNPGLATCNLRTEFDGMEWRNDADSLSAWQQGRTGYPVVDAAMRELWTTGYMHNRARMVAASFLVKHLLIDWREGEKWFWDTLLDADIASNPASWQWVAGTGADAAPYFRIMNPVLQGQKFDPQGNYVKRWLPELAKLPARLVHQPWAASASELAAAGVVLGSTYPRPVVEHDFARQRALTKWRLLRSHGSWES